MAMRPPPTAAAGNDPQQPHTTSQHDQSKSIFLGNLHYGKLTPTSMPIKSSGRIVPPGWAPLQPKQSVLSLIV